MGDTGCGNFYNQNFPMILVQVFLQDLYHQVNFCSYANHMSVKSVGYSANSMLIIGRRVVIR